MAKKYKNPEVRFKGFTEDWKHPELGEVLTERKTMQKISEDAPILAFASGQGVIDRSERKSNNRDHLTLDQENKVYKLTEFNDIVYNPSNLKYGAIDRNKHGRGVISPIYVTFTTAEEPSFIELIVKSEKFKLRALQYEEGTVVKRQSVSPENLLSLKVGVSNSLDEQKKIGKLFEYIEDLINHHQKKYDKLVILKKAMLAKMFPKNGAVVPEIRFKEFTGDWREEKLGDIGKPYTGLSGKTKDDFGHGKGKFVTYSNIFNNPVSNSEMTEIIEIDQEQNEVLFGDVLFTTSSETPEEVGMSSVWLDNERNIYLNSFCFGYRLYEKLDNYFLAYLLRSINFRKNISFLAQGISRYNISKRKVMEITIEIPSPKEQVKIGEYFKNLENQIALHQSQLEKLKNIKKACFSKMLVTQE
ncbi:MAG: restriction endonuclease subunit S [Flavobacteriaceae bacterium]|nr:restriction endonuclease subunit S [Flavobacteriaceae bacterium]